MNYVDFIKLVNKAKIIDTRYPVNGCFIWMPRGIKYRKNVTDIWRDCLTDAGFEEYLFPRMGRKENLDVVANNIKEFYKIYWVSSDKKNYPLYLSPTGETLIYPIFRKWVNDENDLPIRLFQIGSMFRPHECGNVVINADELTTLAEGHSAHASKEEALEQFDKINNTMNRIYEKMGLATLKVKRPKCGNNPVFEDCVSYETFLPSHNRSYCVGVSYYQDQIYSKPFKIKFAKSDGSSDFTYQNTFGLSERSIMAALQIHSDDKGLKMMPELSPEQIVIIPFFDNENREDILKYANEVAQSLKDNNIRVHIDDSKKRPTKKIGTWREMGVPIRIGVGSDQKDKKSIKVLVRDSNKMYDADLETFDEMYSHVMNGISNSLYKQSEDILYSHISNAYNEGTLRQNLESGLISRIGWCRSESCANYLENEFPGEILGTMIDEEADVNISNCLSCGNNAQDIAYFAKRCSSP